MNIFANQPFKQTLGKALLHLNFQTSLHEHSNEINTCMCSWPMLTIDAIMETCGLTYDLAKGRRDIMNSWMAKANAELPTGCIDYDAIKILTKLH